MKKPRPTKFTLLAAILLAISALPDRAEDPDARAKAMLEAMERAHHARRELAETFAADPTARFPATELPDSLADRLDADGDGFVTLPELDEARRRSREAAGASAPRDMSGFTLLHPEGFPLNVDPRIVSADESGLGDEDIVLGVVIGDAARAYPVNYMNGPYNEIVNDTLAGEPIASTW